jgi:transposase
LLDRLNPTIAELSQAIKQEAEKFPQARRLMTHPGVRPLTALAFVLVIGRADRFQCGKQIASYLGLVPLEDSSGNRRRLGHITKQRSSMLRFLLAEAAQVTVRSLPEWHSKYFHLMMRRSGKGKRLRRNVRGHCNYCGLFRIYRENRLLVGSTRDSRIEGPRLHRANVLGAHRFRRRRAGA